MQLGLFGLGRMGANMARRLHQGGHDVIVSNRSPKPIEELKSEGIKGVYTIEELVNSLQAPRAVWLMVPSGDVTDQMIDKLIQLLQPGDALVDGGNSNWKDSKRHAERCKVKGIEFMDEGTSGGIWGLKVGYCLMIGGEVNTFKRLEPAFKTLAPENGYLHCGSAGAGHFVKMVHNGIEYGMMQSYAEGFEILEKSGFDLDLRAVADVWGKGSVVRSWLLELLLDAFTADPKLESIKGYVEDSGEGRWTIQAAIDEDVPAPVITLSLFQRFMSRQEESFAAKVNAALRKEFGGHAVKNADGAK